MLELLSCEDALLSCKDRILNVSGHSASIGFGCCLPISLDGFGCGDRSMGYGFQIRPIKKPAFLLAE